MPYLTSGALRVMHPLLLISLVTSYLIQPGLSLLSNTSGERGGRRHAAYNDSSCAPGRTSPHRRKPKRAAPWLKLITSKVAAFSVPSSTALSSATSLRERSCCSFTDTHRHPSSRPSSSLAGISRSGTTTDGSNHCNSSRFFSARRVTLSTSTIEQVLRFCCSRPKLAARRLVGPQKGVDGADDEHAFRDDRGRIDPTLEQAARPRPARVPSMQKDADDAPKIRRRGRVGAGRGVVRGTGGRGGGAPSRKGAGATVTEAPPNDSEAPAAGVGAGASVSGGINQDDPLVKAWNSTKVLNPSRNEFPVGQQQRERRRQDVVYKKEENAFDSRQVATRQSPGVRGGGRQVATGRGVGRGRGRGRGGRSRGRKVMPVGLYMGNDKVPWYIKEVQDKGLDTEGSFDLWWKDNLDPEAILASIKEMKVDELKAQLEQMELSTTGLKAELAERLAEGLLRFSLSDDNFQRAEVFDTTSDDSDLPNCFPQVYENLSENELEQLWRDSLKKKI